MELWGAKVVTLVSLLLVTLLFGLAPLSLVRWLRDGRLHENSTGRRVLGALNCFAGGVFMGTSFLHLLPESIAQINVIQRVLNEDAPTDYPVAEFVVCLGFFMIMVFEHVVMTVQHKHCDPADPLPGVGVGVGDRRRRGRGLGGETGDEADPMLSGVRARGGAYGAVGPTSMEEPLGDDTLSRQSSQLSHDTDFDFEGSFRDTQEGVDHNHMETSQVHSLRSLVLMLALSLHTVFEGLVLGLQTTKNDLWTLFTALVVHKILIAFTLGLHLAEHLPSVRRAVVFMCAFSMMAPLGVAIGTGVMASPSQDSVQGQVVRGLLEALATGTFFYVTFFEVLQKEMGSGHSLLKVLFILTGFTSIAFLSMLQS